MLNDILGVLDQGHVVLLDLSAAFDIVDHCTIRMDVERSRFGIFDRPLLRWSLELLEDRS